MVTSNKTVLYTIMYKIEFQDLKYPVGIMFYAIKTFQFQCVSVFCEWIYKFVEFK